MCPKFLMFKGYINFLLLDMANSPFFNIDLSLPDINVLLQPRFCHTAIPTTSSDAHFNTPIQRPSNHQNNLIKILDILPPAQTILNENKALQASPWINKP